MILNIESVANATVDQVEMVYAAAGLVRTVTLKPSFKKLLLLHPMAEMNGKTAEEIYAELMTAELNVKVVIYDRWWSRVIGWVTGRNADTIHINRKYMKSVESVASNLLHESSHILGFTHRMKPWKNTVPYALNEIFQACLGAL